jgi:hypothetical protein
MRLKTNNRLAILSPFGFCIAFAFYFALSFKMSFEMRDVFWYTNFFGLIISLIFIDKSKLSGTVKSTYNIGLTSTMIFFYLYVVSRYLHLTFLPCPWNTIFWFGIIFILLIFSLFLYRKIDNDLYLKN